MRLPRWMSCGIASILFFGSTLWQVPLIDGPTQTQVLPFDLHDFRECVEQCQFLIAHICFDECARGAYPPEFNPAGCHYYCGQFGRDCMEACRSRR